MEQRFYLSSTNHSCPGASLAGHPILVAGALQTMTGVLIAIGFGWMCSSPLASCGSVRGAPTYSPGMHPNLRVRGKKD
ncbi:transmembrane protein, putative [Medicago truncatula]|uniref:Transmembrane protein, putative n=1 Tax=Medicago truncatula TaxID=3880 RepID=G7JRW7_MEDTR|nr:transmembrane protein, putative [Medicago truncatula]